MAQKIYVRFGEERKLILAITSAGVGVTGLSVKLNIQQLSDSYWWDGDSWEEDAVELDMTERDSTNQKGIYTYNFTPSNDMDRYLLHAYIAAGPNAFDAYEEWDTNYQQVDVCKIKNNEASVSVVGENNYLDVNLVGILGENAQGLSGIITNLRGNLRRLMDNLRRTQRTKVK